jgi:hypothetical protein
MEKAVGIKNDRYQDRMHAIERLLRMTQQFIQEIQVVEIRDWANSYPV